MAAMSETLTAMALAPISRSVEVDRRKWMPSSSVSVVSRSVPPVQSMAAASSPMPTRASGPGARRRWRSRAISPRSPTSVSVVRGAPAGSGSSPALTGGYPSGDRVQALLDLRLGHCADDLIDHLAALEEEEGRDGPHLEAGREPRGVVAIDLGDRHAALVLLRELVQGRRRRLAAAAPLPQEVDDDRLLVLGQGLVECGLGEVQRGLACHAGPPLRMTGRSGWRSSRGEHRLR